MTLLGAPAALLAQAAPTATKHADLQVGAGFSSVGTDYYVPNRVGGTTLYFDYDFYHHFGIEGEFRFAKDSDTGIYEKTYEVGGRYSRTYFQRFAPYGKVLYGRGVFNFATEGVTTANLAYNIVSFGGGLDYKLFPFLNLRGDYEYQNWFGFPQGLHPNVITIGAAYHFGGLRKRSK
ncbi:MAG: outer membrane beta-barrel protein [Edaphobacter sp.]|uniref:outer membrane beta-barrel protein n=1 Tax=Edaphobacter sp. TaxID=1934404 RepID=UPI0023A0FE0E|nr:outer membrane beta-barrel protein [Edaphobacter sp.]MDE1177718.1 outer membrane beta-barrel protein [Edaphobacter sp.]